MNTPSIIILHHSLTKDSGTVSWSAIRNYHVHTNGWKDIGYHFGIEKVTNPNDSYLVYEILLGRFADMVGSHVEGHNYGSLGICFVGNYDEEEPSSTMINKGVDLVSWLCRLYKIKPEYILGHRDFNSHKSCPGKLFDVEKFRDLVKKRAV
jgi:N-acetylmuramoyl-L-alanine amidase